MNLTNLLYFVTVADCGSYTKAAEQLFITQPALSKQIVALEDELGQKLFIRRKGKPLELTPSGEACLKEARKIVSHCAALKANVHSVNDEIAIAYCPGMSSVADILKFIHAKYNNVHLNLSCVQAAILPALLAEGRADFVISLDLAVKNIPDIEMLTLSHEEVCIFVSKEHNLASRDSVSMSELSKESFILGERSMGPEGVDYSAELCSRAGFQLRPSCYVDDIQSSLYMVSAGYGIAIVPSYAGNLNIPNVHSLRITDTTMPIDLVLACKKSNPNHVVDKMFQDIRKHLKKLNT